MLGKITRKQQEAQIDASSLFPLVIVIFATQKDEGIRDTDTGQSPLSPHTQPGTRQRAERKERVARLEGTACRSLLR